MPAFPFFPVNLLLGLTAMTARTFYRLSQIGMLVGTVVCVNAGTQLAQIGRDGEFGVEATGRADFAAVMQRVQSVKGYGPEELGISTSRMADTNEFAQTKYPDNYAAGDVAGPSRFTHTAAHQASHAAVNALFDPLSKFKADDSVIPWVAFVEPEVARVGLTNRMRGKRASPAKPRSTASTTATAPSPTARHTAWSRC
ncbi:MAG: Mercuric reductase [Candidatus Accumulibacter adjunctus]|uniref:Mercuric reductase n=1 Tax=Candidatus Accumulibacter adjunctus TaxID=1454001 RepID=A0A011NK79_9PROT|nr:MAG: Mercuric reductase [Candidatus Accumulibacter adjunctus]